MKSDGYKSIILAGDKDKQGKLILRAGIQMCFYFTIRITIDMIGNLT